MKYVPALMSLDGELNALKNQNFSNNIMPLIQIIKDVKKANGTARVITDIENIIISKPDINFFITVPRNLNLTNKQLKKPVRAFYTEIESKGCYHSDILNTFCKYPNVIPAIEVKLDDYIVGDLKNLKTSLLNTPQKFCYIVEAKRLDVIKNELFELITENDFLIYNLEELSFEKTSIKKEIKEIHAEQLRKGFKTIVIKQIYKELTFSKFPNGLIKPGTDAYDCIDYDFYDDFKSYNFDYFGDKAGIRSNPIYGGGLSYPAFLTIEMDSFEHHGFNGIEKDPNSFKTILLRKYIKSDHWTSILSSTYKSTCFGCKMIEKFNSNIDNPNSAAKWKTVTICHFIGTIDDKIKNSII